MATRQYAVARDAAEAARARHDAGRYFTPRAVARLVAALAVRRPGARVLDPACGEGALLAAAAERGTLLGGAGALRGVESEPSTAREAAARLGSFGGAVRCADFLDALGGERPGAADVVVANPPYVRHEALAPERKRHLAHEARAAGLDASLRSDLHVFFWPAIAGALAPGGRAVVLCSSAWLDAAYGEPLRAFLLERFALELILDAADGPWFDDARIRPVVVVLRLEPDPDARARQQVRLARLDACVPRELDANAAAALADALLADDCSATATISQAALAGQRWAPPLRAPPGFLALAARARTVPLGDWATLKRGLTSGADAFFYVRPLGESRRGLVDVRASDGSVHSLDARWLRPALVRLAEAPAPLLEPSFLRRAVVLLPPASSLPRGSPGRDYLAWGEAQGFHARPTCAQRTRAGRGWHELRLAPPGQALWSMTHQYRHLAPANPSGVVANANLYNVYSPHDARVVGALLNSTWMALAARAFGRQSNEGKVKTQVMDAAALPSPDPRRLAARLAHELAEAFDALAARTVLPLSSEMLVPERRALDALVLRALGLAPSALGELHEAAARHEAAGRGWERAMRARAAQTG